MRNTNAVLTAASLCVLLCLTSLASAEMPTTLLPSDINSEAYHKSVAEEQFYQGEMSLTYRSSALWQGVNQSLAIDNYMYCFLYFGLHVIDMSVPSDPHVVAEFHYPVKSEDLVRDGNFLYSANAYDGVAIFDITDRTNPVLAAEIAMPSGYSYSTAQGIFVDNDRAYVSGSSVYMIIDVSDPYHPTIINHFEPQYRVYHSVVIDDYAFMISNFGLSSYDISDPNNPVFVHHRDCGAIDFAVRNEIAYVGCRGDSLVVINCDSPTQLMVLATLVDTTQSRHYKDVEIYGDYLYMMAYNGIQIVDVSTPTAPVSVGEIPPYFQYTDISINQYTNTLIVSDWHKGAHRYDLAIPEQPALEAEYNTPGLGYELELAGNFGFQANGRGGMLVLDFTDPEAPEVIASYEPGGEVFGVEVHGQLAFLVGRQIGFHIVDIANPYMPALIGQCDMPKDAYEFVVQENYAFVACGDSGMATVDISTPSAPYVANLYPVDDWTRRIDGTGNEIYLAVLYQGIEILDISDPLNPVLREFIPLPEYIGNIEMEGEYLYVTTVNPMVLSVYHLPNPAIPIVVADLHDVTEYTHRMKVYGDYLYISAEYQGVMIFNISNPAEIYQAGQFNALPGWVWDADPYGDYVLVTCDNGLVTAWRGTCNGPDGTGSFNVADVIFLINYIFAGGNTPSPLDVGDVNCDGNVNLGDAVVLVDFIFRGGSAPCGGCF